MFIRFAHTAGQEVHLSRITALINGLSILEIMARALARFRGLGGRGKCGLT